MSGSSALSSAKNRRSNSGTISQLNSATPQSKTQNQNNSLNTEKKEPFHPLRVLHKHDLMLKKHHEELHALITINNESKSLEETTNNKEITEKIIHLENVYKTLHEEFNVVKKEINKLMSFSIDLNIEFNNFKKETFKKIENHQQVKKGKVEKEDDK
jgi:hypothetical protein